MTAFACAFSPACFPLGTAHYLDLGLVRSRQGRHVFGADLQLKRMCQLVGHDVERGAGVDSCDDSVTDRVEQRQEVLLS